MVFLIINIAMFFLLLSLSFAVDHKYGGSYNTKPIINLILYLSTLFILMSLTLTACFFAPRPLRILTGKVTYLVMGWFCINSCCFMLHFPEHESNKAITIFQVIGYILAFIMVFLIPGAFSDIHIEHSLESIIGNAGSAISNNITVSYNYTFGIRSVPVFTGKLAGISKITWFTVYKFIFEVFLPFMCGLMVLVKSENNGSKLKRQNYNLIFVGIVASWFTYLLFYIGAIYQTMFLSLSYISFLPMILLFMLAETNEEYWDFKIVIRAVLRLILRNVVPAVIGGCVFTLLWPVYSNHPVLFVLLFTVIIVTLAILWVVCKGFIGKKDFLRSSRYQEDFELDITSIDFEDSPQNIMDRLFGIFQKYLDSTSMKILVDSGNGVLDSVYSSDEKSYSMPIEDEVFDRILNLKHPVVFREWMEHDYNATTIRNGVRHLLDSMDAEAFIVLNEGHHIIGVIFLGKKTSGNSYNDYDYQAFNKLYSNLFVIGYYVKNIMNESVVGTVNREIRMSGQIITSIQENMDLIKNPKIDAGYKLIPAHNIGGEFIDLIRLTDTRHIFIIGSLSGKGIAASMSMIILKSVIRTFLAETADFKILVEKVNLFIRNSLPKGTFFAGTFGLLDFNTNTMYYINCGSPAIFMYTRAYNNVIEIQGEGHILGFKKDISSIIKVKKVNLSEGDIVVACTDGLIETKSLRGELFGKQRVQGAITENSGFPADKMAQFTYDSLVQFTSKEIDNDVTILILKYKGGN